MTKSERFLSTFAENVIKRTGSFLINDKKSGTCQRFVQDQVGDGKIIHGAVIENSSMETGYSKAKYEMAAVRVGGILYVVESYFHCKVRYIDGLPSNVVSFEEKRDSMQKNINSVILPQIYNGIDAAPLSEKSKRYTEYAVRDYLAGGKRHYELTTDFAISNEDIACILCNLISPERMMSAYLQSHRNMLCKMKGRYILEQEYLNDPDILKDWEINMLRKIESSGESSLEVEILVNGQPVTIFLDCLELYIGIIKRESLMSVLSHYHNLSSLCKLVRHYGVEDNNPVSWKDISKIVGKEQ